MEIVFSIIALILIHVGLWQLFIKAGRPGWESLIPIYKEIIIANKIIGRPKWWMLLMLIPLVNIFIFFGLYIDLIKAFGKRRFLENVGVVLFPFIVLPLWGRDPLVKYLGKSATPEFKEKYPHQKSFVREWADALVFAVVAATLIRGFILEAYVIPSGSMEKSLLVGDFLFVSKLSYGPRIPMTPIAFPFAHHTMPLIGGKAYIEAVKIPYKRLKGFQEIERNDVVVFNFPMEADAPYNRPIDKRENYIKRAVGIPGDTISMFEGQVFIGKQEGFNPPQAQLDYLVYTDGSGLNPQRLMDMRIESYPNQREPYILFLTEENLNKVKSWENVRSVIPNIRPNGTYEEGIFPGNRNLPWNLDNFGPIVIPSKGMTISLNELNYEIYERAIRVYEGNEIKRENGIIYINGERNQNYTFKLDYYWMMGDNRHNSEDARFWGFVPEDHIVGKAQFVWLSVDDMGTFFDKIRWNRIFMKIK